MKVTDETLAAIVARECVPHSMAFDLADDLAEARTRLTAETEAHAASLGAIGDALVCNPEVPVILACIRETIAELEEAGHVRAVAEQELDAEQSDWAAHATRMNDEIAEMQRARNGLEQELATVRERLGMAITLVNDGTIVRKTMMGKWEIDDQHGPLSGHRFPSMDAAFAALKSP